MVNIPRGLGIRDIADLLQREGVIDQPYVFMGSVIALKARGELKYGEYQFTKQSSVADVVDKITEGKVIQHAVTVPEGLTSEQIVARLLENDALGGQIKEIPREGTLLPETYKFTRGMTREQIIQRMQQAHRRVLQEVWERRLPDLPVKTSGAVGYPCVDRGKGNRQTRRAHARCRSLRQPVEKPNAASVGSNDHLWVDRRQGLARPSHLEERNRAADALQYLCR